MYTGIILQYYNIDADVTSIEACSYTLYYTSNAFYLIDHDPPAVTELAVVIVC